ncbi:MAG: type VI secretion system-associated FHA domain protein, partial [Alsobacter sp.]
MPLRLTVENLDRMPDGGPLSVEITGRRGLDIGRDQHLDWTLPDPGRTVSGKHCEVRFQDGGYWLFDVSTNGTFVNGSDRRIQGPHRLRDGDRLEIGHYLVAVALDGEGAAMAAPPASVGEPPGGDLWRVSGEVAPPVPRRDLAPVQDTRPVRPDFLEWAVEAPSGPLAGQAAPPASAGDDWSWAQSTPPPTPVFEPPPPVPQPRRPGQLRPPEPAAWDDAAGAAPEIDPSTEPVDWSIPPVPGASKPEVAPVAAVPPPAPSAPAPIAPAA